MPTYQYEQFHHRPTAVLKEELAKTCAEYEKRVFGPDPFPDSEMHKYQRKAKRIRRILEQREQRARYGG